ncbi:hypothetical protein CI784_13355 [Arthrobacter agilis]|nr:hypothetical protein B8W74_13335 [Arthrobacter agilis]PPB45107.1 hypothetical protein CI784_13355 [Arthrobacter agilis]
MPSSLNFTFEPEGAFTVAVKTPSGWDVPASADPSARMTGTVAAVAGPATADRARAAIAALVTERTTSARSRGEEDIRNTF